MNKTKLIAKPAVLCAAAVLTFASATQAGTWAGFQKFDTASRNSMTSPQANRHGADDPANHNAGDDRRGRGRGADDPANHNAGDDRGVNPQPGDDRGRHRGRGR
jgi:hypothetical protein